MATMRVAAALWWATATGWCGGRSGSGGAARGSAGAVGLLGGHRGRRLAAERRRGGQLEVVGLAGEAFLDAARRPGTGGRQGGLGLQRRARAKAGRAAAAVAVHAPLGGVPVGGKVDLGVFAGAGGG